MGSASQQYYSLHWSEFGSSLTSAIESLRGDNDLVDVTLAAGGRKFFAHKIVLSAASPFLLDIFKCTPCQHPTVMLDGISANDLASILEFIYRGELSVEQSQLPSLLQAAQCLSIHGLPPSIIMSEKGEEVPLSSLPGCNDPSVARETMNAYLAQRRRKKKRKQEGGGGKWPRSYSIDNRSIDGHSEDNRSLDYGHKDGHEEGEWNSKSRTLSDQPATCPLCGAVIRQSRNLRRHLELLHFGAGSGKSGSKVKKEKSDKSFTPRSSPAYSKASLTALRESAHAKASAANYSSMPSLNLSTSSSSINVPRSSALSSGDHAHHHHHHPHSHGHAHGHPVHNTNPAHTISSVAHPSSSLPPPPTNGLYSSEGASMLSCLLPTLPTLPTLTSPHDMFRHSEFLRANMGYTQDPARQQHANRHLQRTDVT